MLSNFLYFCSRNNSYRLTLQIYSVVNCSQIFCTFAVETTNLCYTLLHFLLWIALKFFVLLQSKQQIDCGPCNLLVVNCSQIFCTFAVETTMPSVRPFSNALWIALKFFVLLQSKQLYCLSSFVTPVVNCSQIFCTFAVETTLILTGFESNLLWIALKFFVLLQSKQHSIYRLFLRLVVNCSQIFCTFAVETTTYQHS